MQKKRLKINVNGLLLLDKPLGFSSNQALSKIKWLFTPFKAGHTGTLDPMATGLLPICLGEATKFSRFLLDADKTYEALIKLGYTSSTGDTEGEIVKNKNNDLPKPADLKKVLNNFIGEINQLPPMYSALKHQGKPLYAFAREGVNIHREKRPIVIYKLDLMSYEKDLLRVLVKCSKGTYLRVLAEDIGIELGVGGYLMGLRRTEIGTLNIKESISLEALEKMQNEERLRLLRPVSTLTAGFNNISLSREDVALIKNGQELIINNKEAGYYSLFDSCDNFFGVGDLNKDCVLKVKRLMSTQN